MTSIELSLSDIERFWKKVQKGDGCWMWTGATWGNYGRLGVMVGPLGARKQRDVRAHHLSYFLAHGHWPIKHVLHTCDQPLCVNPDHLWEGSPKENTADMTTKGRHRGRFQQGHDGLNGNAHITQELADQIRAEYVPYGRTGGGSLRPNSLMGLARTYGISKRAVLRIIQGKTWGA